MTNRVFSKNGRPAFFALASASSQGGGQGIHTHAIDSERTRVDSMPHGLSARTRVSRDSPVAGRQPLDSPASKNYFESLPLELKVDITDRLEPFSAVSAFNASWTFRYVQLLNPDVQALKVTAAHVMRVMAPRLGESGKGFRHTTDEALLVDLRACSHVIDPQDVERIVNSVLAANHRGRFPKACILGPLMAGRPASDIESMAKKLDKAGSRHTRSKHLVATCASMGSRSAEAYEPLVERLTSPLYTISRHEVAHLGRSIHDMPSRVRDDVCEAVLALEPGSGPSEPKSEFTHLMWRRLELFSPPCQELIFSRVRSTWNATAFPGGRQFLKAYFDVDDSERGPAVSARVDPAVAAKWRHMLSAWPAPEPEPAAGLPP